MRLIPNSNGEDARPLREFNQCHAATDGKFCSDPIVATMVPKKAAASRPSPNPRTQSDAADYVRRYGFGNQIDHSYVELDQTRSGEIADAYDALPLHDPSPAVQRAYKALADEVRQQWDHAIARGMVFEPWTGQGQPYATSIEMAADVQTNRHMYFYTGGEPNAVMAQVDPKSRLAVNDMFRAIHDYYGHTAGGFGFGARGEENAWRVHSQMFSLEARRALTTETRGQNSWVNFGRQNYHADGTPKNIPAADRPFATQKMALLPDKYLWTSADRTVKESTPPFVRKPAKVDEADELRYPKPPKGKS